MLNLSLNKLKLIAKTRGIRGYKHMFKERLLSSLSEKGLDNARIIKIREDLNKLKHTFSKSEIKEIRKYLYDIKTQKYL